MDPVRLTTPITEDQVRGLRIGDQVVVSGTVWGLRDATLIHWAAQDYEFPGRPQWVGSPAHAAQRREECCGRL